MFFSDLREAINTAALVTLRQRRTKPGTEQAPGLRNALSIREEPISTVKSTENVRQVTGCSQPPGKRRTCRVPGGVKVVVPP